MRARVDISVYILLCTYCEPFSAKPHGIHERVSNSHRRDLHASCRGPPGGWWRGRKGSRLVVGRGRGRKSEEHSVWRGRRRWRGELDFSDSKFCSSLFPASSHLPRTNVEPPPTRPHRQPPLPDHHPSTPNGGGGGGGCSRVSPFRRAPCSTPCSPRLTPTSHSFLRSLRRPGLALFFLPSAHDHPRRARVLPLPPSSPARSPRPFPSQSPSAPPPPPGAARPIKPVALQTQ